MTKKTIREEFEEIKHMSREELRESFIKGSEDLLTSLEHLRELVGNPSSDISESSETQ